MTFLKNLIDFTFDTNENHNILNLRNYCSKSYVIIVLSDTDYTFNGKGGAIAFHQIPYCVLFLPTIAWIGEIGHGFFLSSILPKLFRLGRQFSFFDFLSKYCIIFFLRRLFVVDILLAINIFR